MPRPTKFDLMRANRYDADVRIAAAKSGGVFRIHRAPVPPTLPRWEPCNEGCDPECGGARSSYCMCEPAKAAMAAAKAE